MRRVLVTGASGYVGGRIVRRLEQIAGLQVVAGSRKSPRDTDSFFEKAQSVQTSYESITALAEVVKGLDAVIHLAGPNELVCARDSEEALIGNGLNSLRLLKVAEEAEVERFVYFSTAHVYGSPLHGTFDETCAAVPRHPYAISHRVTEDFVLAAHAENRITGIVLRLSNSLGAPFRPDVDRWSLVANDFCLQAVQKRQITVRTKTALRDFIALSDVESAVIHMLNLDRGKVGNGLFNLGSGVSTNMLDLAKIVRTRCAAVLGYQPEIVVSSRGDEKEHVLDYRVGKILSTGFSLCGDLATEIDSTLRSAVELTATLEA